jgi:hypothetical protein
MAMESSPWDFQRLRDIAETLGLVGTLLFTAYTNHKDEKARKVANLISLTQLRNQIWEEAEKDTSLSRISEPHPDLNANPITDKEMQFVKKLIIHLSTVFRAQKEGVFPELDGLRQDVRDFFDLPVPKTAWQTIEQFQEKDFIRFMKECLAFGSVSRHALGAPAGQHGWRRLLHH